MMEFTAAQIAGFLHGTVDGDPSVKVSSLAKIEEGKAGSLSFLANPKYTQFIYTTESSAVVVNNDFIPAQPVACTLIRVSDAYASFALLLEMFGKQSQTHTGISAKASVDESATLDGLITVGDFSVIGENSVVGQGTLIHPQVFIGTNVTIGKDCTIYPGVRIYHGCVIGNNCTLHSGVVIGSDGFGFAPAEGNRYKKIPQIGNVVIEDHVEIGSNTTIDRATMGSTIIRNGVKLDNLIQIAHNVEIGENTVIAAQTGVSGSTKIGRNCMIGGQVGIVGHITIADNVKIGAGSGIEASILQEGAIMLGAPAIEAGKARRNFIHWRNLDSIVRMVYTINKKMNNPHE
jgi:UDP-3-O-[3-hydroxymyristoyl] glucosamine N-acyltransferase